MVSRDSLKHRGVYELTWLPQQHLSGFVFRAARFGEARGELKVARGDTTQVSMASLAPGVPSVKPARSQPMSASNEKESRVKWVQYVSARSCYRCRLLRRRRC